MRSRRICRFRAGSSAQIARGGNVARDEVVDELNIVKDERQVVAGVPGRHSAEAGELPREHALIYRRTALVGLGDTLAVVAAGRVKHVFG